MDDLEHFYLSPKESRDMIGFLPKKRKIKNYKRKSSDELLQAIKENKEQQSRNKKRMDIIREKLNNFIRIKSKEIRKNFYNIKKILNLNGYDYKGINSIRNLFKSSIDKPNNYIQYKIIHKNPLHTTIYNIYFYI